MADRNTNDRDSLSIAAHPDDAGGRRETRREAASATAPRRAPPVANATGAAGASIVVVVVLGLIIIVGGVMGYVVRQQLQLANAQLSAATDRIRRLEEQLNVTGSTLSETSEKAAERLRSGEATQAKLTDGLNRARQANEDNRHAFARLDVLTKSLTDAVKTLDGGAAQQGKVIAQTQAQLAKTGDNVRDLTASSRELSDKINAAEQSVRAIRQGIERRVADHDQAIAAIDTYRKLNNQKLSALAADVAALKGAKGAAQ